LLIHCRNAIPHARGLGSSSAAIVAGLWAARACVVDGDDRLTDDDLLRLATRIEGHPDNVAPCLLGGFTIAWNSPDRGVRAVAREVAPGLDVAAFIPGEPVSTEAARGLLPASVPHEDAVFNAARTALLVDALLAGSGSPADRAARLLDATDDRLHQPQRASVMTASAELVRALRADGVAAFISGAGPTVLALTVAGAGTPALPAVVPAGFTRLDLAVDPRGVRVVSG
jgi:homoserine kinase